MIHRAVDGKRDLVTMSRGFVQLQKDRRTKNLLALIDQFNTLLMAGQLTTTGSNNYTSNPRVIVNARQAIYDFVTHKNGSNVYDNITYTDAAPSSAQKRDRIIAIVHLIVTSPDFTILK